MDTPNTTHARPQQEAYARGDVLRMMALARQDRAAALGAGLRIAARVLSWPVRAALIEPFKAWRRRERIRTGLKGMPDGVLHDIGMTRDRLPYLIARERDRDVA